MSPNTHDEAALGVSSTAEMAVEEVVGVVRHERSMHRPPVLINDLSPKRTAGPQDHRTKVAAARLLDVEQV